jgi:thiamine biosynthesis lipoprotein
LVSVTVLHNNPIIADAWSTALLCLGQTEGLKAADANGIAALFIQQQGDRLPESRSQALTQLKNIRIQ